MVMMTTKRGNVWMYHPYIFNLLYRMLFCAGFDKDKDKFDAFSKNCVF